MAMPNSSSEVVAIIASLALLAPLIRALHKWHIDVRKTSMPAVTATALQSQISTVSQGSRWSRMTGIEKWVVISNFGIYLGCSLALMWLTLFAEPRPPTTRDVAMVGLLVAMLVTSSRLQLGDH